MGRNREAGQALYLTAAALVVLMGFMGLGVDMGFLRYEKRLQQTAADGAAVAGAEEIQYGTSGIAGASQKAAADNGFSGSTNTGCPAPSLTGGVGTVGVTVNNPPCSGPHNGDSKYVEVFVSAVQPTYFMRIFGYNSEVVTARAVATMVSSTGTSPGCIYTLGPPGTGIGVLANGTPQLNASSCGILDDGDFTTHGKPVDINAGSIGVVGSDSNSGGGTVTCGGSTTNCPVTGIPPVGDPLSFVKAPTVGSPVKWTGNPVPGTTYSSIDIHGGNVNFPAGTYIVDGNFTVNGNAYICNQVGTGACSTSGTPNAGVTFYITNGGSVTINGTATTQLSAPDSGTYAGVLFDQDPSDTSTAKLDGTSNSYYQGALYFPGAELDFGGTNFTNDACVGNSTGLCSQYTIIVVDDLELNGTPTVTINSDYQSLPGGVSIIKDAVLVE
jgi:Putative Flp pilus-assembly TadE/G-like